MNDNDNRGGFTISGRDNVLAFRERFLLNGLRFEVKCPGMRLTGKAPKCSTIIKREYGLKGNGAVLLARFEAYLAGKQEGDRN